jgi:Na+/melibiose symporter-like transporter
MGFALSGMSFGVLIGPLLGGIVYARAGYYAVIAMMVGLILVDICLPFVFVEKRVAEEWWETRAHKVDEHTRILGETPVASATTLGHHTESQMLNKTNSQLRTLLKSPQILAALWGVIVQLTILASFDAVLSVFLEETFGWSSLGVGLTFLALALPVTLLGPLAGTISDHIGPRWPAVMGCLLAAPPLVLLQFVTHPDASQTAELVVLLVSIGKPLVSVAPPCADGFSIHSCVCPLSIGGRPVLCCRAAECPKSIRWTCCIRAVICALHLRHGGREHRRSSYSRIRQGTLWMDHHDMDFGGNQYIRCHSRIFLYQ